MVKTKIELAIERRELYLQAERAILTGAQSYNIGGQSLTRADLDKIRAGIAECDLIIDGGGRRRFTRLIPTDC